MKPIAKLTVDVRVSVLGLPIRFKPVLMLWSMAGVTLGLGCYTFVYAKGASYLSNDPKACANCHVMNEQYDGWQGSTHHAAATCNDCHVRHHPVLKYLDKAENGFWHSKGFTLQDFREPIRIKPKNLRIVNHNCAECHRDTVNNLTLFHQTTGEELNCVGCHRGVGHDTAR